MRKPSTQSTAEWLVGQREKLCQKRFDLDLIKLDPIQKGDRPGVVDRKHQEKRELSRKKTAATRAITDCDGMIAHQGLMYGDKPASLMPTDGQS